MKTPSTPKAQKAPKAPKIFMAKSLSRYNKICSPRIIMNFKDWQDGLIFYQIEINKTPLGTLKDKIMATYNFHLGKMQNYVDVVLKNPPNIGTLLDLAKKIALTKTVMLKTLFKNLVQNAEPVDWDKKFLPEPELKDLEKKIVSINFNYNDMMKNLKTTIDDGVASKDPFWPTLVDHLKDVLKFNINNSPKADPKEKYNFIYFWSTFQPYLTVPDFENLFFGDILKQPKTPNMVVDDVIFPYISTPGFPLEAPTDEKVLEDQNVLDLPKTKENWEPVEKMVINAPRFSHPFFSTFDLPTITKKIVDVPASKDAYLMLYKLYLICDKQGLIDPKNVKDSLAKCVKDKKNWNSDVPKEPRDDENKMVNPEDYKKNFLPVCKVLDVEIKDPAIDETLKSLNVFKDFSPVASSLFDVKDIDTIKMKSSQKVIDNSIMELDKLLDDLEKEPTKDKEKKEDLINQQTKKLIDKMVDPEHPDTTNVNIGLMVDEAFNGNRVSKRKNGEFTINKIGNHLQNLLAKDPQPANKKKIEDITLNMNKKIFDQLNKLVWKSIPKYLYDSGYDTIPIDDSEKPLVTLDFFLMLKDKKGETKKKEVCGKTAANECMDKFLAANFLSITYPGYLILNYFDPLFTNLDHKIKAALYRTLLEVRLEHTNLDLDKEDYKPFLLNRIEGCMKKIDGKFNNCFLPYKDYAKIYYIVRGFNKGDILPPKRKTDDPFEILVSYALNHKDVSKKLDNECKSPAADKNDFICKVNYALDSIDEKKDEEFMNKIGKSTWVWLAAGEAAFQKFSATSQYLSKFEPKRMEEEEELENLEALLPLYKFNVDELSNYLKKRFQRNLELSDKTLVTIFKTILEKDSLENYLAETESIGDKFYHFLLKPFLEYATDYSRISTFLTSEKSVQFRNPFIVIMMQSKKTYDDFKIHEAGKGKSLEQVREILLERVRKVDGASRKFEAMLDECKGLDEAEALKTKLMAYKGTEPISEEEQAKLDENLEQVNPVGYDYVGAIDNGIRNSNLKKFGITEKRLV